MRSRISKKKISFVKLLCELIIVLVFAINSSLVAYFQSKIDNYNQSKAVWSQTYLASLTLQDLFIDASSQRIANSEDFLKKAAQEATVGLSFHWLNMTTPDQNFKDETARLVTAMSNVSDLDSFNKFMNELNRIDGTYVFEKSSEYLDHLTFMRALAIYSAAVLFVAASLLRALMQYFETISSENSHTQSPKRGRG